MRPLVLADSGKELPEFILTPEFLKAFKSLVEVVLGDPDLDGQFVSVHAGGGDDFKIAFGGVRPQDGPTQGGRLFGKRLPLSHQGVVVDKFQAPDQIAIPSPRKGLGPVEGVPDLFACKGGGKAGGEGFELFLDGTQLGAARFERKYDLFVQGVPVGGITDGRQNLGCYAERENAADYVFDNPGGFALLPHAVDGAVFTDGGVGDLPLLAAEAQGVAEPVSQLPVRQGEPEMGGFQEIADLDGVEVPATGVFREADENPLLL